MKEFDQSESICKCHRVRARNWKYRNRSTQSNHNQANVDHGLAWDNFRNIRKDHFLTISIYFDQICDIVFAKKGIYE